MTLRSEGDTKTRGTGEDCQHVCCILLRTEPAGGGLSDVVAETLTEAHAAVAEARGRCVGRVCTPGKAAARDVNIGVDDRIACRP